jgi:2-haloalkanoic acid dehalogenase type II
MPFTDFKVLSFSCYGTLINRDSGIYGALRPLLARGDIGSGREELLAKFSAYEAQQQADSPRLPYPRVLEEVHRRLAKEWGILASDDDHARFGQSTSNWPVFADAPAALQYLKRFFKLAIVSNADRQTFALSNARLDAKFDAIFTGPEIGHCKPDPRLFEHMAERLAKLGFERRQILHVSHDLQRDQPPAARCGLAFAWIDRVPVPDIPDEAPAGQPPAAAPRYASPRSSGWDYRFSSLVDMVKAHQQR